MGLGKAQFPTCMRKLLTVESATKTQKPGNKAKWGWPYLTWD